MLEEKISYYIAKIKSLQSDIEYENNKIFEYETMLLEEKRKDEERSIFKKIFCRNNFISSINKILKEHHKKVETLERSLRSEIGDFIDAGISELSTSDEKKSTSKFDIIKEKEYLNNIISIIDASKKEFDTAYNCLERAIAITGYESNQYYEKAYILFSKILSQTVNLQQLITDYKLFKSDIESINSSLLSILKCNEYLKVEKYKELKRYSILFNAIGVNLTFLKTTVSNFAMIVKAQLNEIESRNNNLEHDYQVIFINKLRNEHQLDLSKYC